MNDYILVKIDKDDALDMLIERLRLMWTQEDDVVDMYEDMYKNYIDNDVFDNKEFNVSEIVDNDWVNYCDVIRKSDDYYDECVEAYESGDYELDNGYYIEAHKDLGNGKHLFLVRVY